jgi:hypothetical protein
MSDPYLWRYREADVHGKDIDVLALPIEGQPILEDKAGETTIVTWGDDDITVGIGSDRVSLEESFEQSRDALQEAMDDE